MVIILGAARLASNIKKGKFGLDEKVLTKVKAKGPKPISAKKTLKSFAQNSGPLVREVQKKEIVQDNSSLFFKEELDDEFDGVNKWLG